MASLFPCVFINWDEVEFHKTQKKELGQYPAISTSRLLPSENKYPSSLRSCPMYDEIALNCMRRIEYFLRHPSQKKQQQQQHKKKIMKKSLYMTRICYFHVSVHTHNPCNIATCWQHAEHFTMIWDLSWPDF